MKIYNDKATLAVFIIIALVEKIYQAQKERDAAMNARLKLAYSEREELLDHLRRNERDHAGYVRQQIILMSHLSLIVSSKLMTS